MKVNDKSADIAGYIILFTPLAICWVMSAYGIITGRSVFSAVLNTATTLVIFIVIISIIINNKLDKLIKSINEQTELIKDEFAKTRNLIVQGRNNEK